MKLSLPFLVALLIPTCVAHLHDRKSCGTEEPTEEKIFEAMEVMKKWRIAKGDNSKRSLIVIDTYWHVISNGVEGFHTKAEIDAKIASLNQAFSPDFYFNLVNWDTSIDSTWFSTTPTKDDYKKQLRVGNCETFNIYSASVIGSYISFSTMPIDCSGNTDDDGVVIDYREGGATLNHATGHWLGLYHTFRGGCGGLGDLIDDTPEVKSANFGCSTIDSCPNDGQGNDMVENFMDWTPTDCQTSFTNNQFERMVAEWDAYRSPTTTDAPILSPTTSLPTLSPTTLPTSSPTTSPSTYPITLYPSSQLSSKPSVVLSTIPTLTPTSRACPPYKEDRASSGCGNPAIDATMLPFSGPGVGGTVIQITNTKYCLDEGVNVYCRFESSVVSGIRVNDSIIECISPPSNGVSSTEVSYAVFMPDCHYDPAEVQWNIVNDVFDYDDADLAGVVLIPTFGNDESARLIFAERSYNVKWNSDALLLSAIASNAISSNISIDLEVVAYVKNNFNQDLYFQVVQTLKHIRSEDTNAIKVAIRDDAIAPAINSYVDGIKNVGFMIVRIVAYTETFQVRRVHAIRSSKLIGILPEDTDTTTNSCPVAPLDHCNPNSSDTTPPCPPTYTYAENDFDFYPDESCIYPSGGAECVVESDLDNDHLETCQEYEDHPDVLKYCEGMDLDRDLSENCDCNYFHSGAAGCIRNKQSQCCYSPSGGLIMDPVDGGGTRDCSRNGYLNHFLHDILPYIYCCKLNDDCDTYYTARPGITDENYEKPQLSYTFGDPHLESFDHVNFDFNGFGEYVAFCGVSNGDSVTANIDKCQPSSNKVLDRGDTTSVHFRFARLEKNHNGTVAVGVAIEDPTFRKGKQALTVVTHPKKRLVVYDGSNLVKFPRGKKKKNRKKKKTISGAKIFTTPVTTLPDFDIRITFKSGLILRIRENGFGVMTVGFLKQPEGSNNHVGLLGIPDDNDTNDFTAANGTILDMTTYEPLAKGYETIFHDFGKTWMVPEKSFSLFKDLVGSYDFNMFHYPDYLPDFTYFGVDSGRFLAADVDCNEAICGRFEGYLKESCCFDYAVTKNTELVSAIMVDAEREDTIKTILNNTIPIIEGGRNQSISVEIDEIASFIIRTYDEDGDSIRATLERNGGNLFDLLIYSPNVFRLSFAGTQIAGSWKAQVSIEDGNSAILFTAVVHVTPPPCINDKTFRYKGKTRKTCNWVGAKESRRQKMCSAEKDEIRVACPITCGLCCEDNPKFKYTNDKGIRVNCAWIAEIDSRSDEYCSRKKVKSMCRTTCNSCQDKFKCVNNEKFRLDKANNQRSCLWIGGTELRRMKYCVQSRVRRNCPTTCGLCCEDNQDFLFNTKPGLSKDCKWISEQTSRISEYCPQPLISTSCPTTCNSCKTYVDPIDNANACCSLNLKDCDGTWCGQDKHSCETCKQNSDVIWLPKGPRKGCFEKWADCTSDRDRCCDPANCVRVNDNYHQCKLT